MSIWDNIKQFGSNVISSVGSIFTPPPIKQTTPVIASTSPSITTTITEGIGGLINTAFSRIAQWVSPQDRPVVAAPAPSPAPVFVFGSGSQTQKSNIANGVSGEPTFFGIPQTTGIIIVAGLIGFLVFTRLKA